MPGKRQALIVDDTLEHQAVTRLMLVMRGFERPRHKALPFILLTADKSQQDIDTGTRRGCTYYMLKPFSTDELNKAFVVAHLE
jgi:CheY-like chemotaxis protein